MQGLAQTGHQDGVPAPSPQRRGGSGVPQRNKDRRHRERAPSFCGLAPSSKSSSGQRLGFRKHQQQTQGSWRVIWSLTHSVLDRPSHPKAATHQLDPRSPNPAPPLLRLLASGPPRSPVSNLHQNSRPHPDASSSCPQVTKTNVTGSPCCLHPHSSICCLHPHSSIRCLSALLQSYGRLTADHLATSPSTGVLPRARAMPPRTATGWCASPL